MSNDQFNFISNNDAVLKQVLVTSETAIIEIETWDNKRCEICCTGIYGFMSSTGIGQDIGDISLNRESDFFIETAKRLFDDPANIPPSVMSLIVCEAADGTPVLEVIAETFAVNKSDS